MKLKIKQVLKSLLFGPRGIRMGAGTAICRPWNIPSPTHVEIGARTRIGRGATLNAIRTYEGQQLDGRIRIGDDVYIGHDCQFHSMGSLEIGNGCVLSDRVYINDAQHGLNPKQGLIVRQPISSKGDIRLGENVFVGVGSVILSGVRLGNNCVVAAQSVVTRSQPDGSMLAGNPARVIKTLDYKSGQWVAVAGENGTSP